MEAEKLHERELELRRSIRDSAIRRRSSSELDDDGEDEMESEFGGSEGTPSSSRKRRRMGGDGNIDEEMKDKLKEDLIARKDVEMEKINLQKEEIKMKRERLGADNSRYQNFVEINNRQLELEQKSFELDVKERKEGRSCRKVKGSRSAFVTCCNIGEKVSVICRLIVSVHMFFYVCNFILTPSLSYPVIFFSSSFFIVRLRETRRVADVSSTFLAKLLDCWDERSLRCTSVLLTFSQLRHYKTL